MSDHPSDQRAYALIVSAREANQLTLEGILRNAGFEAACASVAEVLALHDLVPPRLVVLDDATTRDERRAVQKQLREHPPLVGVPMVVMARESDIDSFSEAIAEGAAAYLRKPVNPEELVSLAMRLTGWSGRGEWTEKRRRIRRPLILQVAVQNRRTRDRYTGQMLDASGGGCRVELDRAIDSGEKVQVVLHNQSGDSTYLGLGAEVRWVTPVAAQRFEHGMRFTGTTALLAGKILGFTPVGST
jgi:CheY-like chemotaxis protein